MGWIAPAIGLAGSLFGGLMGGKMPQAQKDALNAQTNLMNTQAGALKSGISTAENTVIPTGQDWLSQASGAINPAVNYWSNILSGDRNTMTQALAPEISQITSGNQAALQNASQFQPRGGARSQTLANIPFTQAQQIGNLFSTLRPQAAQQLGQLGLGQGGIGSGLLSSGLFALTGAGSGASATGNSILNFLQGNRQQSFGIGGAIGSGLTNLIGATNPGGWFKGSGTVTGTNPDPGSYGG